MPLVPGRHRRGAHRPVAALDRRRAGGASSWPSPSSSPSSSPPGASGPTSAPRSCCRSGARRRRCCSGRGGAPRLLVLAAPLAALAALALFDLALGGDAHLTRSVLDAGGLDQLADVAERRLRLSADSFGRAVDVPLLWVALVGIAVAIYNRERILGWFDGRRVPARRLPRRGLCRPAWQRSPTTPAPCCSRSGRSTCCYLRALPGPRRHRALKPRLHARRRQSLSDRSEGGKGVLYDSCVRIALVSPYSWTYQGGVNRHVEALAEEFDQAWPPRAGARPLGPARPAQPLASPCLGGAARDARLPDPARPHDRDRRQRRRLQPRPSSPTRSTKMRRELRAGDFDVVHVHEPIAPAIGWDAMLSTAAPRGRHLPRLLDQGDPQPHRHPAGARRGFNQLSARIAVSEAAAWTGRRWFGGEYAIVPNGVDVDAAPAGPKTPSERAPDPLRRPPRGAQGPAGPAHRVRGAWSSTCPAGSP